MAPNQSRTARRLKLQQGRVDLGDVAQGQPRLRQDVDKLDEPTAERSGQSPLRGHLCKRPTRQIAAIIALVWWRRWESKTSDFAPVRATTGNHRKRDPELPETKDSKKHVRENVLPSGKIEPETMQGRADVGDMPIAENLGTLARKVLSSSRHAQSRELARVVLDLLARRSGAK